MEHIELLPADQTDLEKFARLQRRSFAAHLEQYNVDASYMNEGYFRWKYAPPSGIGRVAVATEGSDYISGVAAIPLQIGNRDRQSGMWKLLDIATDPRARGRGLYTEMLRQLIGSLSRNEVLAGFPNKNSAPGFQKVGCKDSCYVPTWISPVLPGQRRHPAVAQVQTFEELDTDRWYDLLVPESVTAIVRSSRYLRWRYQNHPEFDYRSHVYDDGEERGYMVFRAAGVFGRPALYILELWATGRHARSGLVGAAHRYCQEQGISWIVAVTNGLSRLQGARHCLLAVPRHFVPKKQILRGVCSDEASRAVFHGPWRVQMGDLLEF